MERADQQRVVGRISRGAIADSLRQRILSGAWPAGMQVPTRPEVERDFQASPATVQQAFDMLRREGFIQVKGRVGTYVSLHPPHIFHHGLVFCCQGHECPENRFFQALIAVASRYRGDEQEARRVTVFTGVENHLDNHEMRHLSTLVRHHGLAGLVFPENPYATGLAYSILGTAVGLPRVAFLAAPNQDVAAVSLQPIHERALDHLAACGCRRVAALTNTFDPHLPQVIQRGIESRGMTTRPYWLQMAALTGAAAARGVIHLLLHDAQAERPDGLFITDDNLAEYAMAGIVDAGVRVPDQLQVVAHCNFPWPAPSVLPVRRLGYDANVVLEACLELIDEQRQGLPPGLRRIEAVFEDELAQSAKSFPSDYYNT